MFTHLQVETRVGIADVVVSVQARAPLAGFVIPEMDRSFLTSAEPEVMVAAHAGAFPPVHLGAKIFESEGVWRLYRNGGKQVVVLQAPGPAAPPYRLAIFEPDFLSGDIYLGDGKIDPATPPYPLTYPLDELLMVNLLARGRGVLLHAFGVAEGGRASIFAGVSGAGKSTLATLWQQQPGVTLLSDDRVVVRWREGRFWAYGTPWCGDARAASPQGVPLERIFVLRQAGENQALPLAPLDAASRLLVRSFPTFWDAEGMAFTVDFLGRLVQTVPCYELGFLPQPSVVEYVRCLS